MKALKHLNLKGLRALAKLHNQRVRAVMRAEVRVAENRARRQARAAEGRGGDRREIEGEFSPLASSGESESRRRRKE